MNALLRSTIAPTMLHSGETSNILPEKAKAVVNIRLHPDDSFEFILNKVKETINDERISYSYKTRETQGDTSCIDCDEFKIIHESFRQSRPNEKFVSAPFLMIGASDLGNMRKVIKNSYNFYPFTFDQSAGDVGRIHGKDERLKQSEYIKAIQFFIILMKNLDVKFE